MLILILILAMVVLFAVIIAKYQSRKLKYTQFLMNNSVTLKSLFDLNKKYNFYFGSKNFDEENVYDNEIYYDSISCEDYLIYQLQFKKYDIEKEIKNIEYNKLKYNQYKKEIFSIEDFGKYNNINESLSINYLVSLEKNIFQKSILKPKTNFELNVTLYCSKINGEIYGGKSDIFSAEQILDLIERLNDKNRGFYNDREIWNALCRVERGRVSNKMRFSIYQRDGYKCRICGRSEEYDYLEIDHIKPIAKGGKSEYDNLQTLCRRCNKNKGDKYLG